MQEKGGHNESAGFRQGIWPARGRARSIPRRRGARKPVVDRLAESVTRDRHDAIAEAPVASSSCRKAKRFAAASTRSPTGLRLRVAAARTGARNVRVAEREQRFARFDRRRVEAERQARRVVAGEHARRGDRIAGRRALQPHRRARPRSPPPVRRPAEAAWACRRTSETIVDSSPTAHGPASSTSATASPSCSMTCSARVGLSRPERLAEGAASAPPKAAITSRAGPRGARSAIVGSPASGKRMHRRVRRQRHDQRERPRPEFLRQPLRAIVETRRSARAMARSVTWQISGLKRGRPLAAKMRATASPFAASAARP